MKQKHFIDSHKGVTGLAILGMMAYYDQWQNTTAWVYLAMHGGYGLFWVLKSRRFGDKSWEQPTGLPYGLTIWASLTLYWIAPWLICAHNIQAPGWWIGLAVFVNALGVFYHFAADMEKHVSLALRKGLVTTGLWAKCRNPNYFGELLIYGGFAMLAAREIEGWAPYGWIPAVILFCWVAGYWYPNMRRKDKSLARYPEFAEYKKRSKLFIPYVF